MWIFFDWEGVVENGQCWKGVECVIELFGEGERQAEKGDGEKECGLFE